MDNFTEAHVNEMAGVLATELAEEAWTEYKRATQNHTIIDDFEAMEWRMLNYTVESAGLFDMGDGTLVES